jgi:mRNA interferase YafQ
MFRIIHTNKFEKDAVKCAKRGLDLYLLEELVNDLKKTGTVPQKHRPHILTGKLRGFWECHIKADWLLIWLKDEDQKTITLINTGTHSDLFK